MLYAPTLDRHIRTPFKNRQNLPGTCSFYNRNDQIPQLGLTPVYSICLSVVLIASVFG